MSKFDDSLASGEHARLAKMAGRWEGSYKLWLEADKLYGEARQRGTIRSLNGGRHLVHEYETETDGKRIEGVMIIGYHIDAQAYESAWVDGFHSGTSILFSTQKAGDGGWNALTHYGDGQGGPAWGWRTEIEQPDDDTLVITMINIPPPEVSPPAKAVEIVYKRVAG
jgi:Protein of unknown function (DUF1579)